MFLANWYWTILSLIAEREKGRSARSLRGALVRTLQEVENEKFCWESPESFGWILEDFCSTKITSNLITFKREKIAQKAELSLSWLSFNFSKLFSLFFSSLNNFFSLNFKALTFYFFFSPPMFKLRENNFFHIWVSDFALFGFLNRSFR